MISQKRRSMVLIGALFLIVSATGIVIVMNPAVSKNTEEQLPGRLRILWESKLEKNMHEKNFATAEELAARILRYFPADTKTRRILGRIFYETGRYDEAAEIFRFILMQSADDAVAYNNLAMTLFRQQRYEHSIRELQKARELVSDQIYIYYNFYQISRFLGVEDVVNMPFPDLNDIYRNTLGTDIILADFQPVAGAMIQQQRQGAVK
jgi:tetratricopeptide (TPR) repeat protein